MPQRRSLCGAALIGLLALGGCQSWCERHYPCPQQACCPGGYVPAVQAVPAASGFAPTAAVPAAVYPQQRVPTCTCQVPQ